MIIYIIYIYIYIYIYIIYIYQEFDIWFCFKWGI